MLTLNVLFERLLTGASSVAERTISVLLFDMSLQLSICCEPNVHGTPIRIETPWDGAFSAVETWCAVYSFLVFAQSAASVKSCITVNQGDRVDICTLERCEFEVLRADVTLQGLMFAEGLIAGWVGRTSEPIMTFMCQLMSSESRGCKKTLCASFPIAMI